MEDSDLIVDILNIYIKYYNTYYSRQEHLFSGIDPEDVTSTNIQMEKLYEHIHTYQHSDISKRKLLDISTIKIDEYDELYGFMVNEKIIKICPILFPILEYIAKNVNWKELNWKIIQIK